MHRSRPILLVGLLVGACATAGSSTRRLVSEPIPNSVDGFTEYCEAGLERAKWKLPEIVDAEGPRTEANTLVPFNELLAGVDQAAAGASLMRSVHPDLAVRQAAEECEQDVEQFTTKLRQNRELYDAFVALPTGDLDADSKRLVEHTLRDFRRSGVDKDDATRTRLRQIDELLVELGQDFSKNIRDDVRSITVSSAKDLSGLPADYIKAHKPGPDGMIKITTDYPDYIPFMSYADSNAHRRDLYIKNRQRGGTDNEDVLKEILTLRQEKANLLGYKNWADYVTEDKMMKSAANAEAFIADVAKAAEKRAKFDYKELLERKRKDSRRAKSVEDYEKTYYENKVKAEKYSFDPQSVRPYFEYSRVQQGLLGITAQLFGISYQRVQNATVWHPDVQVFDVLRDGEGIGRIYLDMHPREGKYKHAAQFTLRSGIAGEQLPEGVLVCNFPSPRETEGPALLEHSQVVTMFHEFGHLMHHILGGQRKWIAQSGVATEWDFVEAPSQMFEEWAWSYDSLKLFAKHYETGAVIPQELVDRMNKADKFGLGVQTMQQMFYASISLNFHTLDPERLNMLREVKRLQAKYTPFRYVPGTHFHTSFGHLDGYSAIYYTYMWSLVIAKDLLTQFQAQGLMNTALAQRYRDTILVPGGSKDAADLVHDFLGRDFNTDAFQKYLSE